MSRSPTTNGSSTNLAPTPQAVHALHVKDIPESIWQRARHNAISSSLPFRLYIIRLLADCQPYSPGTTPTPDPALYRPGNDGSPPSHQPVSNGPTQVLAPDPHEILK